MPLTSEQLEGIRADAFADDVEISDEMLGWSEADAVAFFESGGEEAMRRAATAAAKRANTASSVENYAAGEKEAPVADLAALSMCQKLAPESACGDESHIEFDSVKSSIDGWVPNGRGGTSEAPTVPYADLSAGEALGLDAAVGGEEVGAEMIDEDELDAGGEERTEDALLDDPMASVPVTRVGAAPPDAPPPEAAAAAAAEEDDGVGGWSVRQLKDFLTARNVDMRALSEKPEYIAEVRRVRKLEASGPPSPGKASAGSGGASGGDSASAPPASPGGPAGEPSARLARLIRKVDDIKRSGDTAFRAKDFEKADRHYTSALQHAKDLQPEESLPANTLAALYSNRSGTRETLCRHYEALQDGREAARLRKGWARAYSRIGAALISLRKYDEAKETYEEGLRHDPGSAEMQTGLTSVLQKLGKTAGGSAAAAEAKQRGNEAFKQGENRSLALSLPTRSLPLASWL